MKTLFLILFLTVLTNFSFSQVANTDTLTKNTIGIYDISNAKEINPTDILIKYQAIKVYKLNESKNETEILRFGPSNADLIKLFTENKNGSPIIIDDLSGINFAAIKALLNTYSMLENSVMQFEESQEIINRQTADMADMQNNLLQLLGEIEELKQKNIDIANDLENFKMEINTKE